jgi:two-component system alkaline phosphatase synthesis response regulator PhoP
MVVRKVIGGNGMKKKILVVDDEESLVRLITYNLNKEGYTTISAYDGTTAIETVRRENPDLVILDLMLPGMDGLDVCRQMRSEHIYTPIIILTAKDEEIDKVVGLELGADDYVTKPFSVRELLARIKAVLRRQQDLPENDLPTIRTVGNFTIKTESYEIFMDDKRLDLTLKEYELLEILLNNQGRVLKRDYLLEALWGYSVEANTRVLDVHISKLREKIGDNTREPNYIKTVRGLGYKFEVKTDV